MFPLLTAPDVFYEGLRRLTSARGTSPSTARRSSVSLARRFEGF